MKITRMLIDYSALCYQVYYGFVAKDKDLENMEDKIQYFNYMMITKILQIQKLFDPNEVIICNDHKSWRKEVFPYYKAQRELKRIKDPLETETLYACKSKALEILKDMNYKIMCVKSCEADDIIAFLATKYKDDRVIIISSDKDFQQLTSENIILYSSLKNEVLNCEDKERFTIELVLRGDTSDGIPNVLSDDDTFIDTSKKQKSLTKVKINEVLSMGIDNYCKKDNLFAKNYDRNKKLILLNENYIPKNIWNSMEVEINNINKNFKRKSLFEIQSYLESKNIYITNDVQYLG